VFLSRGSFDVKGSDILKVGDKRYGAGKLEDSAPAHEVELSK
jgi:hypothetical protein